MRRLLAPIVSTAALSIASTALGDSKATTTEATLERAADDRQPVLVDRGPNRLLLGTGIATLGFTYGVSAWVGATTEWPSERWLLVPVVGPWLTLVRREDCGDPASARCDVEPAFTALFVTSGVLQLGGLVQIYAAFLKRELREADRPVVAPGVAIVPATVPGGAALAARGIF